MRGGEDSSVAFACLLLRHGPEPGEPDGLIFSGRLNGCEVWRLDVLGVVPSPRKTGAELMRCICLSVVGG